MISIHMFFTALTATALAKGSIECTFSEHTGVQQCSGAVGQLLFFHLSNAPNPDIRLTKDGKYIILKVDKNQKVTLHEEYVNQSEFFTNGTLTLGNASKRHSGTYVLEEFGPTGNLVKKVNLHLQIQAPVSKPTLSQMCFSREQTHISCSSEGDGVEFILTLDGLSLIQTRGQSLGSWTANTQSATDNKTEHDKPSVSNVTLSLHGQLKGNLICHVWNNVSRDEAVLQLTSCKDFSSSSVVTVALIASFTTIPVLVGLGLVIRYLHNKPRPTAVNEGYSEAEIVYSDVRVIKNTRKNRPISQQNAM